MIRRPSFCSFLPYTLAYRYDTWGCHSPPVSTKGRPKELQRWRATQRLDLIKSLHQPSTTSLLILVCKLLKYLYCYSYWWSGIWLLVARNIQTNIPQEAFVLAFPWQCVPFRGPRVIPVCNIRYFLHNVVPKVKAVTSSGLPLKSNCACAWGNLAVWDLGRASMLNPNMAFY